MSELAIADPRDASNVMAPAAAGGGHNPRSRKLRSLVWNDFTKEQRADGSYVAICNHCKKQLTASSRSGTTHLKNHLAVCTSSKRIKRKRLGKLGVRRAAPKQDDAEVKGDGVADSSQFDQETSRQDLARMIIMHGYPFSIVHHSGFRVFVKNLQPQFKLVSADVLQSDCMNIYENEKLRLQEVLEKLPSRVSLTVDMWRSMEDAAYICLTAHFIDDDWKLQKKILSFVPIESLVVAQGISKIVLEKVQEWSIKRKLGSVILDNCSAGDLVFRELIVRELLNSLKSLLCLNGCLFQARSCGYLLNLVVQESLEEFSDVVDRVRACVQYVKSSQERLANFQTASKLLPISHKPLVLDIPASWCSTYIMLEAAFRYQEVFNQLAECYLDYSFPSAKDWSDAKAIMECLELLYQAMEKFSASRVPTANPCFNDFSDIYQVLKRWLRGPQPLVAAVAKVMLEKLEQYWESSRMLMAFASILDPRYKMKSIEYYLKQIYDDSHETKNRVDNIHSSFVNLYNEYVVQYANSTNSQSFFSYAADSCVPHNIERGSEGEVKSSARLTLSDTRRGLDQYLQETSSGQPSRSDLDMYLEEPVFHPLKESLEDNFNILAWWKYNAAKYPVLSLMARDILATPVSVVPLDSEARTLNHYLSSTDPVTVQCLICAQDWIGDETEEALALVPVATSLQGNVDVCMILPTTED